MITRLPCILQAMMWYRSIFVCKYFIFCSKLQIFRMIIWKVKLNYYSTVTKHVDIKNDVIICYYFIFYSLYWANNLPSQTNVVINNILRDRNARCLRVKTSLFFKACLTRLSRFYHHRLFDYSVKQKNSLRIYVWLYLNPELSNYMCTRQNYNKITNN